MPQTNDIVPPIDAQIELAPVSFDFGLWLREMTIVAIVSVSLAVVSGTDPTPTSRLIGAPWVSASVETGLADQQVNQMVGNFPGAGRYLVTCVITTSNGQQLSIWSHFDTVVPT